MPVCMFRSLRLIFCAPLVLLAGVVPIMNMGLFTGTVSAGVPGNYLYPDMFPFVKEDAPSNMITLQNWSLSGSTLRFSTMFANQGDGLFEIRRGPDLNDGSGRYQLLQRVYINNDFGAEYDDIPIGTAPIPGSPGNPIPDPNNPSGFSTDSNLIWFENFAKFSLLEAPVVNGLLTVGNEVASNTKASWRLSAGRGPLPGFANPPNYASPDRSIQQRISVGYADMYTSGSSAQYIDIAGVPAGPNYWLRQTVDPTDRLHETDETNNSFEILIDLNKPGEAIMVAGQFVQPGDPVPIAPGDLNEDGEINLQDWLAFQANAAVDLTGLTPQEALLLGDMDLNGQHSLADFALFRDAYDQAQGAGAFAALQTVPEPGTLAALACLAISLALSGRRWLRPDRGKTRTWDNSAYSL